MNSLFQKEKIYRNGSFSISETGCPCTTKSPSSPFIAIPENNAKNSAPQSVNYCVTDFRRTPVRLQICSLQFALCSTAFFALFSGLAIEKTMRNTLREFLKLSRQSPRSRASTDFGSLPAKKSALNSFS